MGGGSLAAAASTSELRGQGVNVRGGDEAMLVVTASRAGCWVVVAGQFTVFYFGRTPAPSTESKSHLRARVNKRPFSLCSNL